MSIRQTLNCLWSQMTYEILQADGAVVINNYRDHSNRQWALLRDNFVRLNEARDQLGRYLNRRDLKRQHDASSFALFMCENVLDVFRASMGRYCQHPSHFEPV